MKVCIKDKKRFTTVLMVIFATIALFCYPFTAKSYSNTLPKKVVVQRGETLWNIVNENYPDENLPKKTYEVAEINKIEDGTIYPGQTIILP